MATKRRKPLTIGDVGVPEPTIHHPREIPLPTEASRWGFVDWEEVHRALMQRQAVSFPARQDEVDIVLRHLYRHAKEEEDCTVPMQSAYCPATGRLWVWSELTDWYKVAPAHRARG
jgi:hypothetical protein